ncbi:unnamed protein product, partial [Onchocerca ochengi]|uniref:MBL fold metallo-hydrolase n=1 Tax=Onchocerca ochengi TaxID=42157 RepID=A0A182EWW1_ONCOC
MFHHVYLADPASCGVLPKELKDGSLLWNGP